MGSMSTLCKLDAFWAENALRLSIKLMSKQNLRQSKTYVKALIVHVHQPVSNIKHIIDAVYAYRIA